VAKAFYEQLKPGDKFFETAHFHIHLPEGATPKVSPPYSYFF
jgi:ATP-dependent Lon protease